MSVALTSNRLEILKDRASMFAKLRSFFAQRNVLEVDCPVLSQYACVDANIDLMPVDYHGQKTCYLHSSPEYGMKRLLAEGIGDIYQFCHVFRDGEFGHLHNPEFSMLEWYRHALNFSEMIDETLELIEIFLGKREKKHLTYVQAFQNFLGIHPLKATLQHLQEKMQHYGIDQVCDDRDELLNFLMGSVLEKQFKGPYLWVIEDFPASQAALSKIEGEVCKRFEVYFEGIELANGYDELIDYEEQKSRLDQENQKRQSMGKRTLPIDPNFLEALKKGIEPCSGVAVGFDRLMLLRHQQKHLADVLPFSWQDA